MKEVIMTSEGYKLLKEELEYLKTEGRDQAAEKIRVARGFGDLSENSEYDEAKNDQAALEARIAELEAQIKHARIMDESELSSGHVHVGSKVKVSANGKEYTYTISGATEADPFNGKISNESPVGKALMGLKVGDKNEAILPNGTVVVYTVLEISK
jgi:transcription elongation factor GreA